MPLYVFKCGGCGRTQELLQSLAEGREEPRPICPLCAAPTRMDRVPASPSVRFVGSGWTPTFHPGRDHK